MDQQPFSETLTAFHCHLAAQDRSPVTIRGYLGDLQRFSRWYQAYYQCPLHLGQLNQGDIQAYRQKLLTSGARPQTINRQLAALAALGHWAQQQGLCPLNPALNVRSIQSSQVLAPRWLDKNQRAALIRAAEKDVAAARERYPRLWVLRQRDATMLLLLLHTGLRLGELVALQLDDLQVSERKGHLVVRAGKGLKQRVVPLNQPARQALNSWLEVRPAAATRALFIGQRGEAAAPAAVQRAVARLARAARLDSVTPHMLRHTFAKTLLDEGVSLEKVAALLGHSSLNTTRIYTVPGEADLEEAVRRLVD